MARDLVPRTIELTRSQLVALSAVASRERRSISWLVRESVDFWLATQRESLANADDFPGLHTMAVSPTMQKYMEKPPEGMVSPIADKAGKPPEEKR